MSSCALCKEMPCCPEHCCNWDDCTCGDCEACVVKEQIQPVQPKPLLSEPVKIILLSNPPTKSIKNPEPEETKLSIITEESKNPLDQPSNSRAAGSGVFGIRFLKKQR